VYKVRLNDDDDDGHNAGHARRSDCVYFSMARPPVRVVERIFTGAHSDHEPTTKLASNNNHRDDDDDDELDWTGIE
jgi:hypothetical protein